jgi:hypothetical protein
MRVNETREGSEALCLSILALCLVLAACTLVFFTPIQLMYEVDDPNIHFAREKMLIATLLGNLASLLALLAIVKRKRVTEKAIRAPLIIARLTLLLGAPFFFCDLTFVPFYLLHRWNS